MPLGLALAAHAGSQPPPASSALRRQLATAPDTARPHLLRLLADYYLYTNFDSAWAYTQRAWEMA